jgi:RNA polymerase sigma-70 factor (sigma-E family)
MVTDTEQPAGELRPGPGPEGFDAFVAARGPALLRRGAVLCGGDVAAAEDLVQHTLVELWRRWDQVAAMDNVEAYARTTLLRRFLREHERWSARLSLVPGQRDPEVPPADAARLDLLGAVRRLPRMQRAVVLFRYYEDLSEAEIASTLGISAGSVKSHSSRAMARLRDLLPAYGHGGEA